LETILKLEEKGGFQSIQLEIFAILSKKTSKYPTFFTIKSTVSPKSEKSRIGQEIFQKKGDLT